MKIVYFGSSDFAVPALRQIAEHVTLVVTQPDRPKGRGQQDLPTPVKVAALDLGLPVETPEKCRRPAFVSRLQEEEADAFVVASYGQILSQKVLDVPRVGCFNLHGSLLPEWRGAAPIQRAILNGDNFSGITLMQMDAGMDTGDIIAKELISIAPDETAGELHDRLAEVAGTLLAAWLPALIAGEYPRTPQVDRLATYAPKIERAESELRTDEPLTQSYRRFRAFTPFPGVFMETQRGRLKILEARSVPELPIEPGVIQVNAQGLFLGFPGGGLKLSRVQLAGKKAVSGLEFARGAHLRSGERL